jgi:DNA-binding transcriptional LysR family regulator
MKCHGNLQNRVLNQTLVVRKGIVLTGAGQQIAPKLGGIILQIVMLTGFVIWGSGKGTMRSVLLCCAIPGISARKT